MVFFEGFENVRWGKLRDLKCEMPYFVGEFCVKIPNVE